MAGIGDSWGTKEELLHPRGPDGRWIRKGGIAKSIINAVLGFLANFRPRTFQNKNQSTQYLHNVSRRQGRKRMTTGDLRRLYDLPNVNEDLQDGVIDNPSTQQFVDMMDRTETELPDDLILTTILPTEAFGFSAQTATGTNSDTDPGIRGVSGKLGADRGYLTMVIGNADDAVPVPAGSVRLIVAAPRGTKVNIPGGSSSDPSIFLTRGQPLRITKIKPDGAGGWHMYATAAETKAGEVPTPIGGPRGLQRPPTQEREAAIRDLERIQGTREGRPDEVAEQADIEARQRKAEANAAETPVPSPAQEAERRRVEALPRQPAAGEPPPRTEPAVGRVGEPGAPGTQPQAPAPTVPEAPVVPRRSVDLRLAVRDAKVPSPSAGSRRRQWNEAYLGVATGKKDPIDAVRELDADIATLRRGGEPGGGPRGGLEEDRDKDIAAFQQLRDLMAREYGLPESEKEPEPRTKAGLPKAERPQPVKTKLSKREQEAEERNQAAAEAPPAPTPVKAPAKKAVKKAAKKAPAKKAPDDLDNMTREELIQLATQQGDTKAKFRNTNTLKAQIRRTRAGAPQAAKKAAPEAPGDDLDKMTKPELLALAKREGVQRASSMNKDQLKAGIRRMREIGPVEPGSTVDKENRIRDLLGTDKRPTVADLRKYAKDNDIRILGNRRDELVDYILAGGAPEPGAAPAKKAARGPLGVPNSDTVRQDLVGMPADDRFPYLEDLLTPLNLTQSRRVAKDLGVRSAGRSEKPEIIAKIVQHFEGAGDVEAVARLEGPPAPVKKAAKAAVPGAAPGTAAGKITAGRLTPGMRILVTAQGNPTNRKTGQRTLTIESVDRVTGGSNGLGAPSRRSRIRIIGRDQDGNQIQVPGDATPSQTFIVAPEPGAAPAKKAAKATAPDKVQLARARQGEIFDRKRYADTAAELDQLIADDVSDKAILSRFDNTTQNEALGDALDPVRARLEAGDRDGARREMRRILEANGVQPTGNAGDIVPFNRREHAEIAGTSIADGDMVRIVRPGHRARVGDEDVDLGRSVVEPATPAEVTTAEKAKRLVPEGSVPGARTDTPVDNAPRKRELRQAWIAADIQPPPGPVRTQTNEIRDKLLAGDITPEESIRMMESEIELNKEDLAEIDAHLREADLTDAEKREFQGRAAKLMQGIEAQEKASTFLRLYFKDEGPVVSLQEAKVQDPEAFEFLKDATPDDMREAAKQAGLDAPSGDNPDEMFRDLIKQVAKKELDRRAAKKAVKKAPAKKVAPPAVPKERERIDARLVGAGLDFDENDKWVKRVLDDVQKDLDGDEKTPAAIGRELDDVATRRMTTAVYEHGQWHGDSRVLSPEQNAAMKAEHKAEYDRVKVEAEKIRELGKRLEKTRRKPVKKAVPSTPRVEAANAKVDDLKKRIIDQALEGLQGAKSRDKGDDALEGLTTDELRRVAGSMGVKGRSKRELRDKILDRFFPETPTLEAESKLEGQQKQAMDRLRRQSGIPEAPEPAASRPVPLSRRASGAGIATPGQFFSDVSSAVTDADIRLRDGQSHTEVAKFLRERAARVAKADIVEEGRRFPVEYDKDSLLSIRKSNAEYLRRVATHVQQEGKATKATPAKKAAPELSPPGEFLELARAERPFTEPSPSRTGTSPVGGTKSTAPEIKNRWGAMGTGGEIEFHPDGVVGSGIKDLGDDRLMDIDGEPLSNVLGKLVTRMNHGEISMDQFIDELNRLAKRLPEGSRARRIVEQMGPTLDAPKVKVDIPEGTPDVLANLARTLAENPLARGAVDRPGTHRDAEKSELAKVMKLIEDFNAGRISGARLTGELTRIRSGVPHESNEGNSPILRALAEAFEEILRIMNDPEERHLLARRTPGTPPAAKKATPRLTAIPGGGSGGGAKKRPKLTVVRNENGEFSFIWGEGGDDHVQLPERTQQPGNVYAGSTV